MNKIKRGIVLLIVGYALTYQRNIISLLTHFEQDSIINDITGILTIASLPFLIGEFIILLKGIKELKQKKLNK